jgi:hypothetical protein
VRTPPSSLSSRGDALRRCRGTILVGILVGLVLLASTLMAVAISGRREQDLTMRRMESMRASYAQEAAAQIAVRELINQQDDDGDGIIGEVAGGVLASGISISGSKGAASADVSGSVWTIQPQGSNGLSTSGSALSISVTNHVPGLYLESFQLGSTPANVAGIDWSGTPFQASVYPNVNATWTGTTMHGVRFRGIITVPAAGDWTFSTTSDDGSVLWINGTKVVDNDGVHSLQTRSGTIPLPAGAAFFDLKYFNAGGDASVIASWSGPTVPVTTVIPATAFTCDPVLAVPPVVGTASLSLAGEVLDGYRSTVGAYGGSNVTSAFSVQTNATTAGALSVTVGVLSANALCGIGGTPSTVITTGSGGSIVGTRAAATTRVALGRQMVPLSSLATSGTLGVVGTVTIATDARYDSITLNTVNAKLVISGHRVVQVDGAFTVGSNCTIDLEPDSSLLLYLTGGNLALSSTCAVNANTADPRRLRVFFTTNGYSMTMSGSANFHGYVFNSGGGLTITGGSTPAPTFYGVFHGNTISTTSTALFRADASFGSATASTNVLSVWRQIQ